MIPLKTTAWKHQEEAVRFCMEKRAALLALSMGCGKSWCVLSLIVNRSHKTVLIVCPKSVMQVWPKQFDTHHPGGVHVEVLNSGTCDAKGVRLKKLRDETDGPLVVVVNYDAYWRGKLGEAIVSRTWDLVVLDESHRIKAPGGRASFFAKRIPAHWKLALTGTPMPHSPLDLYGQFRFLDRTIFGTSFTLFRDRYAVMGGFERRQVVGWKNEEEMNARLYSITYRVGPEVLDLPEAMHVERTFDLTPKARKVYRSLEDEFCAELDSGIVTAANCMVKVLRLQQVTSGYVKADDDGPEQDIDPGKAALLRDILEDLDPNEPVVVFCRFRHDLETVHEVAKDLRTSSGELSGSANHLELWQAEEFPILAVQIQSGGLGVDLTRARYAIYFSIGYSLGEFEQSLARIHRPGQTKPCTYIHLIASNTVDEKVYEALRKKKDVIETILTEGLRKENLKSFFVKQIYPNGTARNVGYCRGKSEAQLRASLNWNRRTDPEWKQSTIEITRTLEMEPKL